MTNTTQRRAVSPFAVLAILGLSGLGLAACNNNKDPVAESQANAIESSADTVRAAGEVTANAVESSGAATSNATDVLANTVRDERNAQANEMDASADAVRKAGEKK